MSDLNEGLEALAGRIKETESDNPSPESKQQQAKEQAQASEADQAAREWGMLMFTIGGFAQMIAPELKAVYTEDRCYAWGKHANTVGEKYGWNGPSSIAEFALILSTIGFAVPTYFLLRSKIKDAKDGAGPSSWIAKMGLWWRTRKARGEAMKPSEQGPGKSDHGSH